MSVKIPTPRHCRVWTECVPLYGGWLHLVLGRDPEAIKKGRRAFDKTFGADANTIPDWDGSGAMCSCGNGEVGMFFHRKHLKPGVIAHEVAHACARVLQNAGVQYDADNLEAYTYLVEWMTDWVWVRIGEFVKK